MRPLLWKECHENLKWVVLPALLILAPVGLMGAPALMDLVFLYYLRLVAALFGAVLGFVQILPESRGDKRSLLLHRPLSRSQIFLGKALAGVGLYLLALGIPFGTVVVLAATPGHVARPFAPGMTLPGLADVLTGLVYYFAGMLAAQREARWYGSRCLGLAAGLGCSVVVWTVPEFWQALLAISLTGAVVAAAARGSFLSGGAYTPQPRPAKAALVLTFLLGLSVLSIAGKFFAGVWVRPGSRYYDQLDRRGHVLRVRSEDGTLRSVTDLEGRVPEELRGKRLDRYELREIAVDGTDSPGAHGGFPRTRSYRNENRFALEYKNDTRPGGEGWYYVPARGRLLGYDKQSKRFVGSFGPDGFARPDEGPGGRFRGQPAHRTVFYLSGAGPYLAFPDAVYAVDFRAMALRALFVPAAGETVLWASEWEDAKQDSSLAFVGTDRSIHAVDGAGSRVFSAPLAYAPETYRITHAGRLEGPRRYWLWYEPCWSLSPEALETLPAYVVTYDGAGRELSPRQEVPPRPGGAREVPSLPTFDPSPAQAWFGLATPPAEAAALVATTRYLLSDVRRGNGKEVTLSLLSLISWTQFFIPGVRWDPGAHADLVSGFAASMLVGAVASGLVCYLLARRHSFSRARRRGWALCGFAWGVVGLLLMLAIQEWPARIRCPSCGRQRGVDRERCGHCGAARPTPEPDGTEIFEETAAAPHAALAGR
jgi:hypothetical protein